MNNKRLLQIESWQIDDFIETISNRVAQKLADDYDCCGPNAGVQPPVFDVKWLTSSEVCDKLSISPSDPRCSCRACRRRFERQVRRIG